MYKDEPAPRDGAQESRPYANSGLRTKRERYEISVWCCFDSERRFLAVRKTVMAEVSKSPMRTDANKETKAERKAKRMATSDDTADIAVERENACAWTTCATAASPALCVS